MNVITSAPVVDSFETTPEYATLREALRVRSWARLETELDRMPPDELTVALVQLGDLNGVEAFLEQAVAENPQSHLARTALAVRYIALAWLARSRKFGPDVSELEFVGFVEWLGKAEVLLSAVLAGNPDCAPAWAASLYTARGLRCSHEELRHRYDSLAALSPRDYPAQIQVLQFMLPKWYGTWDEAELYVREVVHDAPQGSSAHALVALLNIERWCDLGGDAAARAHLQKPEVLQELRTAARSLLASEKHLDPVSVQAHNAFAMVFWCGDHLADALQHVQHLDGRASEFPWRYVLGPQKAFHAIHRSKRGRTRNWFGR